jgi:NAD-dependent deacetylase
VKDINIEALIEEAAGLITVSKSIVVFTGAGISTESGIPDFRSPGGIWEKHDPNMFTFGNFIARSDIRKMQWKLFTEGKMAGDAKPNTAHFAVADLDKLGKLDCVVTQNIDFLHQRAGVPDNKVLELHGTMRWAYCLNCGKRYYYEEIKKRLDSGDSDPKCQDCHGIIKPDVVLFGEAMPEVTLEEAYSRAATCDLCIVIGSSLVVYPAALVPYRAVEARARLIIINLSQTALDDQADVLIHAKAGETMPDIVKSVKRKLNA